MRIRTLLPAAILALLNATPAAAQDARPFRDAWFWGVKAGGLAYARPSVDGGEMAYGQAPLVGGEWLITRTHGALLTSFSQGFLTQQASLVHTVSGETRLVDLENLRRLDIALLAFPGNPAAFRPYAGIGFTLQTLGSAVAQGDFESESDAAEAAAVIQEAKAASSMLFVVGGQYALRWASVFGQATLNPSNRNWFLYNGRAVSFTYEIGLRYNIGSSIAR
jgi:hypothetical protein